MRLFLTGGTGFIGSNFINQAHAAGHEVVAMRRSASSLPRVPLEREPTWIDRDYACIDVADLLGCTVVVHMAAHSANVPYDTLEACIEQNVLAPLKLFRTALKAGVTRIINAGSCFEYGRAGERYEFIPVDAPLEPTASYPASKAAASVAFHAFACEENIELLTLRIFQVYGEGELESRFWPSLRKAALSGADLPMTEGLQVRDFVGVQDVAAGFLSAVARTDLLPGRPLMENLGSGHPQSLADFARGLWSSFGASGSLRIGAVPMRKNEVMRFVPQLPPAQKSRNS